jgi:hypothetical protein
MASDIHGPATSGVIDLDAYGLLPQGDSAIQIDITAVLRRDESGLVETYLCDHNCTISHQGRPTGGHYNCPAAFTANRGAIVSTIASSDLLLEGIDRMAAAVREANAAFIADEFARYAAVFQLPQSIAAALRAAMARPRSEVTLFGGSPEAHPEIVSLVRRLNEHGHAVHITMTGRRAIRNPDSFAQLAAVGPEIVAVSLDDVCPTELATLLEADQAELRSAWRSVSPLHGQRQKVFEALHLARLWEALPEHGRPGLLVNMAVHEGNLDSVSSNLELLSAAVPAALLNPFPMQSAFEHRVEDVDESTYQRLAEFIDAAIIQQHARAAGREAHWQLVPRMHFWLLLAAAMREDATGRRLSGWNTWQCYRSAGASRYVQIAGTGRVADGPLAAGGRVGCFWNDVLNDHDMPAIWQANKDQLRTYLEVRPKLAARRPNACPGCLFPRLVGDMISAELGMDPMLRDTYLRLRRTHLGF